jgi:tetratricopeptide (TPR) repeat protein
MVRGILLLAVAVFCVELDGSDRRTVRNLWLRGDFQTADAQLAQWFSAGPETLESIHLCWKAELLIERGSYSAAVAVLKRAEELQFSDRRVVIRRRRSWLWSTLGRLDDAEKAALEGTKWDGKSIKSLRVEEPMSLNSLGEVYFLRGADTTARAVFELAMARAKKHLADELLDWIRAHNNLARVNLATGDAASAVIHAELAVEAADKEWGPGSIPSLDSRDLLGAAKLAQSKTEEAEAPIAIALATRLSIYGPEHLKVAESLLHAALVRSAQKKHDQAIDLATRGLLMYQQILGGINVRSALAAVEMADVYAAAGRKEDAKKTLTNAISTLTQTVGELAPVVERIRRKLAD